MKNKKSFILLILMLFLTTGCVRENIDLTINKDKSMNLSMDMGLSKTFLEAYNQENGAADGALDLFDMDDKEIEEMKKKGVSVEKYDDGSYTGIKAKLKIKNIDSISTTKEVDGDLESIVGFADIEKEETEEQETEETFLFTVKKGFFKNEYRARLNSSMSDEIKDMTDTYVPDSDATINNGTTGNNSNNITSGGNTSTGIMDDFDPSILASGMDLRFTVNLPYKALSHNAPTVENDGKKLSWNLMSADNAIEFSFELYNMKNIYLLGGGIVLIVLLLIVGIVLFTRKKGNKNLSEDKTSIDRGMKESYPAVTNMIGPMPTSENQTQQVARVQSVPVTTKPVLQPNPITPTPQPIGQTMQQTSQSALNAQVQQRPMTQTVNQSMPNNQNVGNPFVQTEGIRGQGQMNYNQNGVGVPTMNTQANVGQQPVSMNSQQPMNPSLTANGQVGQAFPSQVFNSNGQNRQVPTNSQTMNQPMSMNSQPQQNTTLNGQSQTNANPTDIFGQNNSFQ